MDGIKSAVRRWPLSIVFPSQALPKAPVYYQPGPEDGSHSLLLMENNSTLRSLMFLIHRTPHWQISWDPRTSFVFCTVYTSRDTLTGTHTEVGARTPTPTQTHTQTHTHTHTYTHIYTHTQPPSPSGRQKPEELIRKDKCFVLLRLDFCLT